MPVDAPAIDPDRSKGWLARARPLLRSHRRGFAVALALSFAGLVLQVQVPDLLNRAVDDAVVTHRSGLASYVWWIAGLGVGAGACGYGARLLLFRTAYRLEYDLRTTIYEHLARLSFPFYDRVQSGQLISRANSDIRSVQLYLTFAPLILVQCAIGVVAFGQAEDHLVRARAAGRLGPQRGRIGQQVGIEVRQSGTRGDGRGGGREG